MWKVEQQLSKDPKSLWDARPDLRTQMEASPVGVVLRLGPSRALLRNRGF